MTLALAWPCMAAAAAPVAPAPPDCVHLAAAHQGVHPDILRAIGWHESRLRPEALARNRNGTLDIGAFQINSIHLARLAPFGIDAQALRDGCVSAQVAAWHYRQQVDRYGHSWRAVGAYHSHTPARAAWYANAIASVLMRWRVIPRGALPFDAASALAPGSAAVHGRPSRPPDDGSVAISVVDYTDAASSTNDATAGTAAAPTPDDAPMPARVPVPTDLP